MATALRKVFIIAVSSLLAVAVVSAQNRYNKYEHSYAYQKAMEAYDNEDYENAEKAFLEEISEHPKNGYAHLRLGIIQLLKDDYGNSASSINTSLNYIPKKDKTYLSWTYTIRAKLHEELDSLDKAIQDYSTAIAILPQNETNYELRANLYFVKEQYDLADKDYLSALKIDENSAMPLMGLGRNENKRKNFPSALKYFDKVIALYTDYSSAYSFRAESYIGLKKWKEAASDIVRALSIDSDDKAFLLMQQMADSSFIHISTKLKAQAALDPNSYYWPYCLGIVNERAKRFQEAIDCYAKANRLDESAWTYTRISYCCSLMGEWNSAIENINKAIALDPEDHSYISVKADFYYEAGQLDEAVRLIGEFIEKTPDYYGGYYRRGWFKDNLQDIDGAIEDYSTAIELEPDFAYSYLSRGNMYLLKGNRELALEDFRKVVQIDTVAEIGTTRMYALHQLGRDGEAVEWMDKLLDSSEDEGIRYDAACLYSLMGDVDKSLFYLEESLKRGNKSYHHILTDDDLDNARASGKFQELMEKYLPEQAVKEESEDGTVEYEEKTVEVPFTPQGGVTKVKCEINGLPLHFIFDTGASIVSLSALEANFMYKNGYITSKDIVGSARFTDANGDISTGTVINLRNVTFGGLELTNVSASVVANGKAPLLLGQSVLNRLGKIEIDYDRSVLRITSKVRKQ